RGSATGPRRSCTASRPPPPPWRRPSEPTAAAAIMCSVIAHLDLDAFYAACEQLDNPELRGVPLIVGGDPHGRGVVATASYEARRFGIHSAMSCAEALRRCPQAVFVRPDFDRYRRRSRAVWALVSSLVERVEQVGIDEGYLDLAACDGDAATAQ